MKTTKLTYFLILGLVLTFSSVGCKKSKQITPLPAGRVGNLGGPGTGEAGLNTAPTYDPGRGPIGFGGGETTDSWSLSDFNEDRAAFAAQTVHFDFDSSVVKSSEQSKVETVASGLQSDMSAKLLIEGHCDERGTEEYNRSLGERRALALREALAKIGVDPARVRTISYGEDMPVSNGHNEAAWSQNRRGVFVLMHPKQ